MHVSCGPWNALDSVKQSGDIEELKDIFSHFHLANKAGHVCRNPLQLLQTPAWRLW